MRKIITRHIDKCITNYFGFCMLFFSQPHNILLASKENSAPIKIADFGVAMEIGEEGYITSGK